MESPVAILSTLIYNIRRALTAIVSLIFPPNLYCLSCGKAVDKNAPFSLCPYCSDRIGWGFIIIDLEAQEEHTCRHSELDMCLSAIHYGLYSRHLILDLKYKGHTYLARHLSEICYERIAASEEAPQVLECDYIIPVPMHPEKEKKRGFNQAEKIASHLGRLLNIPTLSNVLVRTSMTEAQKNITGYERFENLHGAFWIADENRDILEGKTVLLFDDIYTTGATAENCAKVLKNAGVSKVIFMSVATGNEFATGYF